MKISQSSAPVSAPSLYPVKDYWMELESLQTAVWLLTLDKNTGTLWGISGTNLVKSTNNGDTWVNSGTKTVDTGITISEMMVTSTGALIATGKNSPFTNGYIYRSTDGGVNWTQAYDWTTISYVLANGWCEHPDYDGAGHAAIYVGEYTAEASTGIRLLRSTDDGATFSVIDTKDYLGTGIRHWHFVTYDEWDDCIWLGSGDLAAHDKLYKITDGATVTYVNGGTYDWKFVTVVPEKGCLYCFSDRTDLLTGVPVYKYLKGENKLITMGYCSSCAWYGAMVDAYRIPFWITQANSVTSQNSCVQGYVWDEYVREIVRIPIVVGTATVHIYCVCSKDDYVFVQMGSTTQTGTSTELMRLRVKPIRARESGGM